MRVLALVRLALVALASSATGPVSADPPRAEHRSAHDVRREQRPARAACRGPCNRPEMVQLLLPEDGETLMLTNFGMLLPRTTSHHPAGDQQPKYELLCEETFGGKVPPRATRHPDGRLFFPGADGLYITGDRCGFSRATGSVQGQPLIEVVIDPQDPQVIWALGKTPAALHVSRDGGASFSERQSFAAEVRVTRLLLGGARAAGAPPFIFIAGYTTLQPLALLVSDDGGQSFTTRLGTRELFVRSATVTEVLAAVPGLDPASPPTLLLAAGSPQGPDQIWRSTDAGASWTMAFALQGMEVQSGFARDPDSGTIYLAGRELFVDPGMPPAHLYVSADGGASFATPIPSGQEGPRYRCLETRAGRLYACAGEPDDSFLVGQSDDGGRSWSPVAQLADLAGQRLCAGTRCFSTAVWLCTYYGAACEGLASLDGGSIDAGDAGGPGSDAGPAPAASGSDGGCGCRVADRGRSLPPLGPVILGCSALAFAARRGRRRRH